MYKILLGYKTDHSLIYIEFKFGKFTPGKCFWKFNNSLLKDQIFVEEIKSTTEDNKKRYAVKIDNRDTMNEIPANDLQLSIFDVLLMEIRGKTIAYLSHKKKRKVLKKMISLKKLTKWKMILILILKF